MDRRAEHVKLNYQDRRACSNLFETANFILILMKWGCLTIYQNYNCQLELLASAVALDCQYRPSLKMNDIGYSQNFRRSEGVKRNALDNVNNLENSFNKVVSKWWYTVEDESLGPIGSKVIYKEDGMEEFANAAIREKKSKYKLCWRTRQPEDWAAYLAANREAKKAVSKANSDRYKAVYDMLDTTEGERAVYRLVRVRHRSTLDMEHTKIVKGADGAVLRRSGQILERWREYYNHLCNKEFCHPAIPGVPSVEGPVLPITAVEVSAALTIMKSNKTTGPDNIPADVWKLLGDEGPRGSQLYLTRSLQKDGLQTFGKLPWPCLSGKGKETLLTAFRTGVYDRCAIR
ncbi:hypothetical protein NECAME_01307 [Necator americanus]|uniref:Uncharacterized protein n=1 Tax=Necator americanus TaxID=51031 RepID=W2TYP5_NECAM|nr:hypothetical protein NECAME_01307 [Necator americanus]ETN86181.1 hypothetical protein NECAME_01307 [Necator americanus]